MIPEQLDIHMQKRKESRHRSLSYTIVFMKLLEENTEENLGDLVMAMNF